jgi:pimeloyl-ACP methyl ester carboxylesterase
MFPQAYSHGYSRRVREVATVVLVDLPGTGASDDLPPGAPPDFLPRALLHTMDEVPVTRVNLVGMSATGPLAYRIAQRYPWRVRRLVLASTVLVWPDLTKALEEDERDFTEAVVRMFVAPGSPVRDLLTGLLGQLTPADAERIGRNWRALTACPPDPGGGYEGPALVVTGELDPLTPPGACRELAASLARALFTTIRRGDHLVHLERADEVGDLLCRFLTDRPLDGLAYLTAIEHPHPKEPR